MRAPAHCPMPWLLALALGVVACGDDGPASGPASASAGDSAEESARESAGRGAARAKGDDESPSWAERLAQPSVPDLLAALAQPHAEVRGTVGPHQLRVVTDFELTAQGEPDTRALDAPVVEDRTVHDELELRWDPQDGPKDGSDEGSAPGMRLSLSQTNDHERGRDVVVIGETIHVRHAHRPWYHYPQDSEIIEQWLDDAQRSVHDAVQLAAPQLALRATSVEGAGLQGGSAVEITLERAEQLDPSLVAAGPTQGWRGAAELEAVEGTVRLDAGSGAWLSATVDVRYRLPGADGRVLAGHMNLQAQLAPGPVSVVEAPEGSSPLPRRLRYDDEQQRLLDGLAAP